MSSKPPLVLRSRLKLRQLTLLAHLDEERCVLRAAEAAGMTQPAASRLLREMEEALNVRLFERHARGIAPTGYGEILVRHARAILSRISLAQQEIATLRSGLSGRTSIGAETGPGTDLVPVAIGKLKAKHPELLASVELDHSRPLIARLRQGQLDMVVARIMDHDGARELHFEPLSHERYAATAGAHHPLAGRRDVQVAELARQPWILPPPDSALRDRLVALFLQRGLPAPSNVIESQSLPVITRLLGETHCVVALPEEAVRPLCRLGALAVLIPDLGLDLGPFGIVTRRGHDLSPGAQALLSAVRETAASLRRSPLRALAATDAIGDARALRRDVSNDSAARGDSPPAPGRPSGPSDRAPA